jgi:hypothetical protein
MLLMVLPRRCYPWCDISDESCWQWHYQGDLVVERCRWQWHWRVDISHGVLLLLSHASMTVGMIYI